MSKLVNRHNNILKYLFLSFLTPFLTLPLLAQQVIIDESEPWTKDQSPYLINDNILVKNLTIEPGVVVLFNGNYRFDIDGILIAEGTKSDSIVFKPLPIISSGWQGIAFESSSSESKMSYCRVEGTNTYGIQFTNSSPAVKKCDIINNQGDGIRITEGETTLINCMIINNSNYGVNAFSDGKVVLNNCIISKNESQGIHLDTNSEVVLTNCIISYNAEFGIYSEDIGNVLSITNSVVAYNSDRGILSFDATIDITNSIIYFNGLPSAHSGGAASISYSDIENWDGEFQAVGNIESDPLFHNDTLFTLTLLSPCIDAGDPAVSYYDVCFPPSLGTETNDMGAYGGPIAYQWYDPLYITPQILNFDNVTVDSLSVKQISIKNCNNTPLTIESMVFNGDDADNFSLDSYQMSLDPFDSTHVHVHFIPDAIGPKNAILNIMTNAGTDSISLIGFGVAANILTSSSLNFSNVSVSDSLSHQLIIRNGGTDTLRIFKISTTLTIFSLQELHVPLLIPPLQRDTIYVTFKPDSNIAYLDSLQIVSNDPDNSILYVTLQGTGLASVLTGIPSGLDFGEVLIYSDSSMYFELTNTGNDTLKINSKHIIGSDSIHFTLVEEEDEFSIPPGMPGDTVVIKFAPDSVGAKSAYLRVLSDDPFRNPVDFPLMGIGVSPEFFSSPNSINFGRVPVDTIANFILEIYNPGTYDLSIDSTAIMGADSLLFSLARDISGFTIPPTGGPDTIMVTFSPSTEGLKSAKLIIYHNDWHQNPSVIAISGEGVIAPEIHAKPTVLDFGTIYISDQKDSSVILYNKGQATLHIDSMKIVADPVGNYSIDSAIPKDTIAVAEDSLIVNISFSPKIGGIQNAFVRVYSDDPLNDSLDIPLTGTGKIDETPATIRVDTSQIKLIRGEPFTLEAAIDDDETSIDSTQLFFRQGGQTSYDFISFDNVIDSICSFEIAGEYITERGFEYYIETYHGGRTTTYPGDSTEIPSVLLVDIPELDFTESTRSGFYQMISLPVNPLNQTLSNLFGDDLCDYDDREYRIFDYDTDTSYVELNTMDDTLVPGKALWLITREAKSLDLQDCRSVPTDQDYVIPLRQGWNMIGVPFAFPVAWDNIDTSGTTLFTYTGNEWIDTTLMVPFQGYAIYSKSASTLKIPPREADPNIAKPATNKLNEYDWQIQIKAKKDSFYDRYNFAGVRGQARFGKDNYDAPEPPVIGKFVSLYFNTAEETGMIRHLAKDFRDPNDDLFVFDFYVMSNFPGQTRLDFVPQNLPENLDWMVVSQEGQIKYPKGSITIIKEEKLFRLLVGGKEALANSLSDYQDIPVKFKLTQNFPNPFNPVTNIRFELPSESRITLEIFDILGRRVKTLLDNQYQESGYHQITWDGRNQINQAVASGVYLLNFRSKHYNKVIKMILQR